MSADSPRPTVVVMDSDSDESDHTVGSNNPVDENAADASSHEEQQSVDENSDVESADGHNLSEVSSDDLNDYGDGLDTSSSSDVDQYEM